MDVLGLLECEPALAAAQELIDTTPEELLRVPSPPMADFLESYLAVKQHVLVRFGKWREIIAQELPKDRDLYCSTTAMTPRSSNLRAREAPRELLKTPVSVTLRSDRARF